MANTEPLPLDLLSLPTGPTGPTGKLPPLADLVFRRLFEDTDLLCALVNALLHREGGARIASLRLTDGLQPPWRSTSSSCRGCGRRGRARQARKSGYNS